MTKNRRSRIRPRIVAPEVTPSASDWISKVQAASFIAEHVKPDYEKRRAARDKVAKRIAYALETGHLRLSNGGFIFGELTAWAVEKWPRELAGIPRISALHPSAVSISMVGHTPRIIAISGTLAECQSALQAAQLRIGDLEDELAARQQELERLRPLADRCLRNVETNRLNGGRRTPKV